jgi:hypothetical protein
MTYLDVLTLSSLVLAGVALADEKSGERAAPDYEVREIDDATWGEMSDVSWHAQMPEGMACPARDELRIVTVPYVTFDGDAATGELVVHADVAEDIGAIFAEVASQGDFRINTILPVRNFPGDSGAASDDLSMAANNTSAFNCRLTTSGTRLSDHSYGTAIDINPVQNPYVTSSRVLPPQGEDYATPEQRATFDDPAREGVIVEDGPVVRAFKARGWSWGGNWNLPKDYQHFSRSGG